MKDQLGDQGGKRENRRQKESKEMENKRKEMITGEFLLEN